MAFTFLAVTAWCVFVVQVLWTVFTQTDSQYKTAYFTVLLKKPGWLDKDAFCCVILQVCPLSSFLTFNTKLQLCFASVSVYEWGKGANDFCMIMIAINYIGGSFNTVCCHFLKYEPPGQ